MDSDLPRSLQVLWGRTERRLRPQRALSLDRIVAAAVELADTEGLPALSMARLAERLGSATMSLYRHVSSKDELLVFMMDAAPGEPPELPAGAGWRDGLQRWALALRAVYYRHPWILQVSLGRPPLEPGQLAWLDAGLSTLAGTPLRPDEKMAVVLLLLNYVRGEAHIGTSALAAIGVDDASYWQTVATLVEPDRFPALSELLAAEEPAAAEDESDGFELGIELGFGLARILDGIEAFLQTRVS
jgi:AcrR family transcriptional regulator